MRRSFWYVIVVSTVLLLAGLLFFQVQRTPSSVDERDRIRIGEQTVHVEIADTEDARTRGLSGRKTLSEGEGMLFVFPEDGLHAFWMKDMRFSIDIVWFSREGEVVDITSHVSPDTYPTAFSPQTPARYVLELPAGFVEEYAVKIGDVVMF